MSSGRSIVFDRAADFYDRTRALPPETQAAVTALLAGQLRGVERVLELGVGTGRMALPLVPHGIELIGVDLSEPMLRRLSENAGGVAPFPLVRADGIGLPLRAGSVGAAFLCHVLHLIPRWRDVVAELVRVVRPGGVLLVDMGWRPTAVSLEISSEFNRVARVERPRPGLTEPDELDAALAAHGAAFTRLAPIKYDVEYSPRELVDRLAGNEFSSTWSLTNQQRMAAVEQTRAWALARYGDLDARRRDELSIQWRRYELT